MHFDYLWKGIVTTVMGATIWVCGAAGRTLFAESQPAPLVAAVPDPAEKFDLMERYGPLLVLAGTIWTTWLGMKAKKDEHDRQKMEADREAVRRQYEADREARRRQDESDRISEIHLAFEKGIARMELIHAEAMAAEPPKPIPAPATEEPKS